MKVGLRSSDVSDVGLRYRATTDTARMAEYRDAPPEMRTFENRCQELSHWEHKRTDGRDFVPLQGAILSPPERQWTIGQVERICEEITGKLHEMTREDMHWGGMGVALMYMKLGRRHADLQGFLPNHVIYARLACGITSEQSLRGASDYSRSFERMAVSPFGYEQSEPGVDISPLESSLALAHYEFIMAYMHAVIGEDPERKEAVRRFRKLEHEALGVSNDEWLQGRCAYLACAMQLARSFPEDGILGGVIDRFAQAIYERCEATAKSELHSSAVDAATNRSPENSRVPPLWPLTRNGWPWLGARSGLIGVLHTLMQVESIRADAAKMATIRQCVDWVLRTEQQPGNFGCVGFSEPGEKTNWADGAGGAIMFFALAFEHFRDPQYANAAQRAAERLWTYAMVRNSAGLYDGIAGNGYSFLRMYNCARLAVERAVFTPTSNPEVWMHRAYMCARMVVDNGNCRPAEFELSLADGHAGVVCFLLDLLEPKDAIFPLFEIGRF